MTFTVTYRSDRGGQSREVFDAPSRAELFNVLKSRGITPVSVREGESIGQAARPGGLSGRAKGLLAGALVVLLAGAACWFVFSPTEKPPEPKVEKPKAVKPVKPPVERRPRAQKPVEPIVQPTPPKEPDVLDATRAKLAAVRERMKTASPYSLDQLRRKERDLEDLLKDKKMQFYATNKVDNSHQPFKTCTEQVLDWVFNTNIGDNPPPFVPPMDAAEMANIGEILDRANEVLEDDTPEVADRKQMVEQAKKELKAYIAQGGSPSEFLNYYYNQLQHYYEMRLEASDMVRKFVKDTDPETARKFLEKTNAELAKKGIQPVMLSDKMKAKMGLPIEEAEAKESKGEQKK